MISAARFVNINGATLLFNENDTPFKAFDTDVEMRTFEAQKAQQHGLYPAETYYGKRTFHVEGDLLLNSSAEYMTKRLSLQSALLARPHLKQKKIGTLYITWDGISEELSSDCTLDGYPSLPIQAMQPARGDYMINWKSFDPRCYGVSRVSRATPPSASIGGGRTYPKTYPKTYAPGSTAPSDIIVSNSGNIEVYPTITVYGPTNGFQLSVIRPDNTRLSLNMLSIVLSSVADYVVIDFRRRLATLNNGQNVYNLVTGDWWTLEPGTSTVQYRYISAGDTSYADVAWRNGYMI